MLVYIDESGDTGFKFDRNSSKYFTVAAVVFPDPESAELCSKAIDRLAERVGRSTEYKFSGTTVEAKSCFFECIRNFDFHYAAMVMNKPAMRSDGFRHKDSLIKCTIRYVFSHLELANATVVVDRSGSRDFRRTLQTYLRGRILLADGSQVIKKVRSERSHADRLVQLADMVCGAVAKSFDDTKGDKMAWRRMIKSKERKVQKWP